MNEPDMVLHTSSLAERAVIWQRCRAAVDRGALREFIEHTRYAPDHKPVQWTFRLWWPCLESHSQESLESPR